MNTLEDIREIVMIRQKKIPDNNKETLTSDKESDQVYKIDRFEDKKSDKKIICKKTIKLNGFIRIRT